MYSFCLWLNILYCPALAHDVERPGAVSCSASLVLHYLRHAGAFQTTSDPVGVRRHRGCDSDRVRVCSACSNDLDQFHQHQHPGFGPQATPHPWDERGIVLLEPSLCACVQSSICTTLRQNFNRRIFQSKDTQSVQIQNMLYITIFSMKNVCSYEKISDQHFHFCQFKDCST